MVMEDDRYVMDYLVVWKIRTESGIGKCVLKFIFIKKITAIEVLERY